MSDVPVVGGKNASLGEMIQTLGAKGITVPSGFAVTSLAYRHHLDQNKLVEPIKKIFNGFNVANLEQLEKVGDAVRTLIRKASLPLDLEQEIRQAYKTIEKRYGALCDVAVRSSATAEDLPEASFAGQQDTYLNIKGEESLLTAVKDCFASLFTNRAISYREHHNFDHFAVALSAGIQKMIRSDRACSGVIFTLDTESGFKDVVFISSSYGLGENIVQGAVNPDEFYIHKPTLALGFRPILKKRLGSKLIKKVYAHDSKNTICDIDVPHEDRIRFSLNDEEILTLARAAVTIEDHYSARKGSWSPMDIEWAKDGFDNKLYIVQARPETVHSNQQHTTVLEEYEIDKKAASTATVLAVGKSIGRKVVTGVARVIDSALNMNQVLDGEIVVTDMTDPDWEPIMKKAGGIVTNRGGRTCHAAIVSRELGIAAVVGTSNATSMIKTGQLVTIDCSSGENGLIYQGRLPYEIRHVELKDIQALPVQIMMNVANPDEVFSVAKLPCDGVGLARLEFIINSTIQVHPMALVHPERVLDPQERQQIDAITYGYADKKQFFIDKLSQEAATIAAAFYPKPVIIRMSDFKSNEYKKLIGGAAFEPVEENPMIGFRGASRYYHEKYKAAFELECLAMKKIREEKGLTNVKLMIPFVRTVAEGKAVVDLMRNYGLVQGKNDLEIYMMCEIPSNVLLIDQFSKVFDGFSIGSNDLTQTVLAVDRDSDLVASIFDERNDAVMQMLMMAIEGAKRNNKKISICGQAPSDYPELAQALVKAGINALSLNPDAVVRTRLILAESKV